MNPEQIESLWRSPHNHPTPAELAGQRDRLIADLRRRRRTSQGLLWVTALPLLAFTARIALRSLSGDAPPPVDWNAEWAVIPFLALPWIGWFLLLRHHWNHLRRHPDYDRSIRAGLEASLDENRVERQRSLVICGLLAASVPLLLLVVQQLRAVHKAGDEILLPALVGWPLYVTAMIGWLVWGYCHRLLPRGRQLEHLLAAYREPGPA
ncbi:MAG: hypothetical protein J0L84_18565 [Verrucomicrobia bacterium]|nr:hypothetical protein [Verrucomicrobiota bacterium]